MYMAVRKYQIAPGTAEEALRHVEEGFVPSLVRRQALLLIMP